MIVYKESERSMTSDHSIKLNHQTKNLLMKIETCQTT